MSAAECFSFHPGHHLHHSKIDDFNQPRSLVDVSHVMENAFLITLNGVTEYWFHHDPQRLLEALTKSHPEGIEVTADKKFLFISTGKLIERFNMTQEQITSCIRVNMSEAKPSLESVVRAVHEQNKQKLIQRGISA